MVIYLGDGGGSDSAIWFYKSENFDAYRKSATVRVKCV